MQPETVMPKYRVEALEKFVVRTVYHVEAPAPQQAEALCKAGQVAYDDKEIEEGDEEWIETVLVETCA
jgi:hypothetical protein